MRSVTDRSVRARLAFALAALSLRPALGASTLKRTIASLVAFVVLMGMTDRAQFPETRAAVSSPEQTPSQAAGAPSAPAKDGDSETAALRAETLDQLKAMGALTTPEPATPASSTGSAKTDGAPLAPAHPSISTDSIAQKAQQKLLEERLAWLEEHARLTLALKKATSPEPSPEHQAEQLKAENKQLQATLAQSTANPESLLPHSFQKRSGADAAAIVAEMKDAIDAATHELAEWKTKAEALKTAKAEREANKKKFTVERDKDFQVVTASKARTLEFEAAVIDAQNAEKARLARERLQNHQWQVRVETLRLQVIEAQIALEAKMAGVRELEAFVCYAHIHLAERELAQMRARYKMESDRQESDLARDAANEKNKAQYSDDPVERFAARRKAELLELEAQVLKFEQALATSPAPSFEEQQTLADQADRDFVRIKELLDDGRVSRLDAIRLNNEFRLIGPERDQLVRNEMATVEARLQYFEDALTNVEIELLQNSRPDRYEHDLLRERVPRSRSAEVENLLTELDRQYRLILVRRRLALLKLSERASHTLQQITRRLSILDQEYGFIRTQIFWVRDQDPLAFGTFWQGAREFNYLLKAVLHLAQEATEPNLWSRPSAEFMVVSLPVLILPVLLFKLRRTLGGLIVS